eukprot:scaffold221_cov351-Pavlova_lutheri.AAC.26
MAMRSALVTGAGRGIGKALATQLAEKGYDVTVLDVDGDAAERTAREVRLWGRRSMPLQVDVTKSNQLEEAFRMHAVRFGGMEVCCNNAGIGEQGDFCGDGVEDPNERNWRDVVDVNLVAILHGTRLAMQLMKSSGKGGHVINVASAGGLHPMEYAPVYAATKAAVVQLGRSLAHLAEKEEIFVCTLCPEFTRTMLLEDLQQQMGESEASILIQSLGKEPLEPEQVADAGLQLLTEQQGGVVLLISQRGKVIKVHQQIKGVPNRARL